MTMLMMFNDDNDEFKLKVILFLITTKAHALFSFFNGWLAGGRYKIGFVWLVGKPFIMFTLKYFHHNFPIIYMPLMLMLVVKIK